MPSKGAWTPPPAAADDGPRHRFRLLYVQFRKVVLPLWVLWWVKRGRLRCCAWDVDTATVPPRQHEIMVGME